MESHTTLPPFNTRRSFGRQRSRLATGKLTLAIGILAMCYSNVDAQPLQTLKNGDRVVFFGDSITQQGGRENGYVMLFEEALKAADLADVEVINAGISGHKVPNLQKRLERDVLSKQPTHVVIYIGINDVWHSQKKPNTGTTPEAFVTGLRSLIEKLAAANVQTILCTPSVIGEKSAGSNDLDVMLEQFSDLSREIAAETKTPLLDLRSAFLDYLTNHNPENLERGVLTGDRVHLNNAGNQFVANRMLAAFGLQRYGVPLKPLRHIVLFQFTDTATEADVNQIVRAFAALPQQVDSIIDFEHGTDISPENKAMGFTHCFVVSFADAAGRDAYLPHPAHKAFVELLGGKIEKALVFDYVTK